MSGCAGCDGDDARPFCDPPFNDYVIATAVEAVSDEQLLVAANWFLRDDPCDSGRIGAAIYDVDLVTGESSLVSLQSGVGSGAHAHGEFVVIPTFMNAGSFLYTAPTSDISSVAIVTIDGAPKRPLAVDDRILILVPGAAELLVRDSSGQTSVALENTPSDYASGFGRLWFSGSAGVEMVSGNFVPLGTAASACASDGPISVVGDVVALQCASGGLVALSSTGGGTGLAVATPEALIAVGGDAASPYGFVSLADDNTYAFSFAGGLIDDPMLGPLDDGPIFLTTSLALVVTNGLARRVSFPSGATSAAFQGARSDGAQMDLTPGGKLVVAQGGEVRALDVHVVDAVTGDALRAPISLPPPEPYYEE